jgi:hypothetical protein
MRPAVSSTSPTSSTITLTLLEEEARWLATAVTVLQRILLDSPTSAEYRAQGLRVLRRVAEHLPPGYYPSDEDQDSSIENDGAR